jgi:parallel beta-helix repeat protein
MMIPIWRCGAETRSKAKLMVLVAFFLAAGAIHSFNQTAHAACTYVIDPASNTFPPVGGDATVEVTTGDSCSWTAVEGAGWLKIISGSSGRGKGKVVYRTFPNTGSSQRSAGISIADKTHTVIQDACSYAVLPDSRSFSAAGGTGTIDVSADDGCDWTAAANAVWVIIVTGGSASGDGTVSYSVQENTGPGSRVAAVTVAGYTHRIVQVGTACALIDSPGTYRLSDFSAADCLDIITSGVVLDGQGLTMDGSNTDLSYAVRVSGFSEFLTNVNIENLTIRNYNDGILFQQVRSSTIENCTLRNNRNSGIYFSASGKNLITGNSISTNNYFGIMLNDGSHGNTITENVVENQGQGIQVGHYNSRSTADNTTIKNNDIRLNKYGIDVEGSDALAIEGNTITLNWYGIYLSGSTGSTISANIIADNGFENEYAGIYLIAASGNMIYNNEFENFQNFEMVSSGENTWSINRQSGVNVMGGPFLGGNFWGDYHGFNNGPSVTCSDSNMDYICDSKYTLASGNEDLLPLKDFFDLDRDGIGYLEDNCPFDYNPGQNNFDTDDHGNACDNCWYMNNNDQTDTDGNCPPAPFPADPRCGDPCEGTDTDRDGIPDHADNCKKIVNSDQSDADDDTVGDACDNCINASNLDQQNSDSDNYGDVCDNCWYEINNSQLDSDGDCAGFSLPYRQTMSCGDACDQCPDDPGKTVPGGCGCGVPDVDSDGDGIPDCNDACPADRNKVLPGICGCGTPDIDTDGDAYFDCQDNCIGVANNQTDSDQDGLGDACDSCPNLPNADQQEDSDGDRLGDICDNCPQTPNRDQIDTDNDDLGDACDPDDDNDTVKDENDNCPRLKNPGQEDDDGDGVGDKCDNCPLAYNPNQDDFDWADTNDGVGDACDNCIAHFNPDQSDLDGDGDGDVCDVDADGDGWLFPSYLPKYRDNCPLVANVAQEDTDGDGKGDACNSSDDKDGDEWADKLDNCPDINNPAQLNTDGDLLGDVCDQDDDNDGLDDLEDNCSKISNPGQEDGDFDRIGDPCDNCPSGYNNDQRDDDADGVGNICDNCQTVENPGQEDSDNNTIGDACDCKFTVDAAPEDRCRGWYQWNFGFGFDNPAAAYLSRGDCGYNRNGSCSDHYGNYKQTFGNCEICWCGEWFCTGWWPTAALFSYTYKWNGARRGHCFGMSLTSLMFYNNDINVRDYSSASYVGELAYTGSLKNRIKAMQGKILSDVMANEYIGLGGVWGALSVLNRVKNQLKLSPPRHGIITLFEQINDNVIPEIAAHAVVVAGIEDDQFSDIAKIYVYDSESSEFSFGGRKCFADCPYIEIDKVNNEFVSRKFGGTRIYTNANNERFDNIGYHHYSDYKGDVDLPIYFGGLDLMMLGLLSAIGEADAQIEDGQGRVTGFETDGTARAEIPNAAILPSYGENGGSGMDRLFVTRSDSYKLTVNGYVTGSYEAVMFGDSSMIAAHDVQVDQDTKDIFKFNSSLDMVSIETTDTEKPLSLEIVKSVARDANEVERVFRIKDATIFADSKAIIKVFPDSEMIAYINLSDRAITYSVQMETTQIGEEDRERLLESQRLPMVSAENILLEPMTTHILAPENWTDLDAGSISTDVFPVEDVTVPNVVGLNRQAAEQLLYEFELFAGPISWKFSDSVPEEHVCNQSPEPGALVAPGSTIGLTVRPDISHGDFDNDGDVDGADLKSLSLAISRRAFPLDLNKDKYIDEYENNAGKFAGEFGRAEE